MNDLEISAQEATRLLQAANGDAEKAMYNYFNMPLATSQDKAVRSLGPGPATIKSTLHPSPTVDEFDDVTMVARVLSRLDLTNREIEIYRGQAQPHASTSPNRKKESFTFYLRRMGMRSAANVTPARRNSISKSAPQRDVAQKTMPTRTTLPETAPSDIALPDPTVRNNVPERLATRTEESKTIRSDKSTQTDALVTTATTHRSTQTEPRVDRLLAKVASDDYDGAGKRGYADDTINSQQPNLTQPSPLQPSLSLPASSHQCIANLSPSQPAAVQTNRLPSSTVDLTSAPANSTSGPRPTPFLYHIIQRQYSDPPHEDVLKTFNMLGAAKQELKTLAARHCRAKWVRNDKGKMVITQPAYQPLENGTGFYVRGSGGGREVKVWIVEEEEEEEKD
jgi:hypothetical protein